MNFKIPQAVATGRPNYDQDNHPPQHRPLHLADVHQLPLGEPQYGSCSRLGEVMEISHDSATRFLQRERYEGKDLYNESAPLLILKGGTLSVDDTVLDKPYSQYLAFVSVSGRASTSVP